IIGATLPKIIREFQWSYVATGFVISASSLGYFVSTFVSGILLHRFSPKQVIVTGLLVQSVGLAFFAATPIILFNFIFGLLMGLGQGGTEVIVNYAVIRIERSGQSRLMNFMHAAFSVGAILGPFAVSVLIASGSSWQAVYRAMSLASLIMAGIFFKLPLSRLGETGKASEDRPGVFKMLKQPLLIMAFLILFLYVGTELGVSAWVAEYYVKILETSESIGALMVSIFWIGLLMGRLGLSGYRGIRQAEWLLSLSCTCTLALIFALLVKGPWLVGFGFFIAGLGFSAIYPLVIAIVGQNFKHGQGVAVGVAATGGGIGSFAFPFIMSAISNRFGIRRGFIFYIALDILMTLLICGAIWQIRMIRRDYKDTGGI
ncbi:MFS transporter, partial [Candidatus Poribacteria bacterium]|nr:MFS transporter [Candidatus Poribacteria bacterium]